MAAPAPAETEPPRLQTDNQHELPYRIFEHNGFELITGFSNPDLARRVGELLEHVPDEPVTIFRDGEIHAAIRISLRRRHAIIIESTSPPDVNGYIMETLIMIDAAKRASAGEITVVLPYYGYARQDRKDKPRVAITASLVANMLVMAGANRIVTVDIHAEQEQGYVQQPWDNLYASHALVPAIQNEIDPSNLVVVSPDIGGFKRASKYAKALNTTDIGIVYKERDVKPNSQSRALLFFGDVGGKDVVITDDIIDSGGTLANAAEMLKKNGASRIIAAITHGLFSEHALDNIANSPIEILYITDSVAHREEVLEHSKIRVVSIAPLLAEAIDESTRAKAFQIFSTNSLPQPSISSSST